MSSANYPTLFGPDDNDRRRMYRQVNPETSIDAAYSVNLSKDRRLVLEAVTQHEHDHPDGFTRSEIAELVVFGRHDEHGRALRARIESIRRRTSDFSDFLEDTGERRDKEAVLKLKKGTDDTPTA